MLTESRLQTNESSDKQSDTREIGTPVIACHCRFITQCSGYCPFVQSKRTFGLWKLSLVGLKCEESFCGTFELVL